MTFKYPLKTIREYRAKGYTIKVAMESTREGYEVLMFTQTDVKRFAIPSNVSLQELQDAIRGL